MPYDLCLFDLDGTLTDPKIGMLKAYQYSLAAFGIEEDYEFMTRFIGPPLRDNFRKHYGFSEADTEKAVAIYREYLSETGIHETFMYPQIPEILQELSGKGVTLAVATSKADYYAEQTLKQFDLEKYFVRLFADTMEGSLTKNGKQEIVRIALDELDPERKMSAVMIGDREHDIIAAIANSIDSIGITWGYGSQAELESAGATWIADSATALCSLVL